MTRRGSVRMQKALKEAFSWNKGYKEFCGKGHAEPVSLINILPGVWLRLDCSSMTELMLSNEIRRKGR